MRVFEALLDELGMPWAPHKQRGPARVMEFLGHLVVNTPELQCIGLTSGRQRRTEQRVDEWLARAPAGDATAEAEPLELAVLLGHLVFCAEVPAKSIVISSPSTSILQAISSG